VSAPLLAERNGEAAAENRAEGLPFLSGSQRQVGWAETIRQAFPRRFAEYRAYLAGLEIMAGQEGRHLALRAALRRREDWHRGETSSTRFIDARLCVTSPEAFRSWIAQAAVPRGEEHSISLTPADLRELLADPRPVLRQYALRHVQPGGRS